MENEDLIKALKFIDGTIPHEDVVVWLNENDVDYGNWTTIQMYIYYLTNK